VELYLRQAHHAGVLDFNAGRSAGASRWNSGKSTLLAPDLQLIKPRDHAELSQRATELKRMLAALS
jgi:hypothetical protein